MNDRNPPWKQEGEQVSVSFGQWLRRQREIREVPLREIADVTKISLRYLEALEQDRFDVLPAPVFAKGFLREYSKYVGLDDDEVVNSFLIASGEIVRDEDEERKDTDQEPARAANRTTLFAILAVAAIVGVVAVLAFVVSRPATPPPRASAMAAPVLPPPAAPVVEVEPQPAAEVSPLTVIIDFTEDCWVEAVVDEDRTISELRVQGESMRLEAEGRVLLTLGNPAGVQLEVNGKPYDFSVSGKRIVRNLEIDLDLAQQLEAGDL